MTEKEVLLEINHLKAYFPVKRKSMKEEKKVIKAVDDISIEIYRGKHLELLVNQAQENPPLGEQF